MTAIKTTIAITLLAALPALADIPGLTTQPVNVSASVAAMTKDATGNLWMLDRKANAVDRLTPAGVFTSFTIPTPASLPYALASGPDGNLWFLEAGPLPKGKVGKVSPTGAITEFVIPPNMTGGAWQIAVTPDGNVWFLELIDGVHVGRLAPDGTFTDFAPPNAQFFGGIAPAAGGIWLIDTNASVISKMQPDGTIALAKSLPSSPGYSGAVGATALDGTFWFVHGTNAVARITTDGTVTEFPVPTQNANPAGVAIGGDGNVWFSEYSANQIGQLIVSTATSDGHATINESSPFGSKLADIFFVPPASGANPIVSASVRAPSDSGDCLPPEAVVRKDDGTSGNLVRVVFKPPSNCANLGIGSGPYTRSRTNSTGQFNFTYNNAGKDSIDDGTIRLTVYPDLRVVGSVLLDCGGGIQACSQQGSSVVCSMVGLATGELCTGDVFLKPVAGLDDILIANLTISSSTFDQDLSNNVATARIDTRTSESTPLPPDSLTPVVTNPVKRGGH